MGTRLVNLHFEQANFSSHLNPPTFLFPNLKGKAAVDALRNCLSPDVRDLLCPLRNGGVSLHKLYGVMHDTCNCANKVTPIEPPHYSPYTIANPTLTHITGGYPYGGIAGSQMRRALRRRSMGWCGWENKSLLQFLVRKSHAQFTKRSLQQGLHLPLHLTSTPLSLVNPLPHPTNTLSCTTSGSKRS